MTGNANFMRSVGGSWRSGGLSRAWRAGVLALACVIPLAGSPSAGRAETPPSTGDYNCRNTGSFQRWLADFETLNMKDEVKPLILKENARKVLGI